MLTITCTDLIAGNIVDWEELAQVFGKMRNSVLTLLSLCYL